MDEAALFRHSAWPTFHSFIYLDIYVMLINCVGIFDTGSESLHQQAKKTKEKLNFYSLVIF
jgi:hypothetical protein